MKIVIFGLTISSSWGNGHATLWRGLCRALADRGHRVVFCELDRSYYAAHRDYFTVPRGALRIYGAWDKDGRDWAREELRDADVGIVTSYCADAVAATTALLASPVRLRVFYDLDTPVTLEAVEQGRPVNYIGPRGLADYHLVLSYTGGRALELLRDRLGAQRVAPLYGSVDPQQHRPVAPAAAFQADLSYLGTYAEDRQAALEQLFLEPARRRPARRFLIGGAQYPAEFPWVPNLYFVQHLGPAQHAAFFSSCRLTLNVTRRAMKVMGFCPSGRLFEAAACGAPLLSDAWEGLDAFFRPGEEILIAGDTAEVVAALDLPANRLRQMARQARDRVLEQHTAAHRAGDLERALDEAMSPVRRVGPAEVLAGKAGESGAAAQQPILA